MKILLASTQDAARTQLAAGMARVMAPFHLEIQSAGLTASEVSPWAVRVMHEVGVDISGARARDLRDVDLTTIDVVISLSTDEVRSPTLSEQAERLHWPIEELVAVAGEDDAQTLARFRAAREGLRAHLRDYLQRMTDSDEEP